MIGFHPNVRICKCVYREWHALCCSANTQSKRPRRFCVYLQVFVTYGSLSLSPPQLFLKSRAEVFISRSNPNSRYPCPKDQREEASGGVCLVWVKPGSSPGPVYILCLQPPAAQVTSASHNSSSASSLHMLINSIYI